MSYLQSSRFDRAFVDAPERIEIPARKMRDLRNEANKLAALQSATVLSERLDKLAAALTDRNAVDYAAFRTALAAVDAKQANQLLAWWRKPLTDGDVFDKPEVFAARRKALLEKMKPPTIQTTLFADFHRDGYKDWFTTGRGIRRWLPVPHSTPCYSSTKPCR